MLRGGGTTWQEKPTQWKCGITQKDLNIFLTFWCSDRWEFSGKLKSPQIQFQLCSIVLCECLQLCTFCHWISKLTFIHRKKLEASFHNMREVFPHLPHLNKKLTCLIENFSLGSLMTTTYTTVYRQMETDAVPCVCCVNQDKTDSGLRISRTTAEQIHNLSFSGGRCQTWIHKQYQSWQ